MDNLWCSTIIYVKQRTFEMWFHLMVPDVLFSLKTCLRKDRGDSFSWLLEREIWLSCIEVLLLVLWSIQFGNHPIDFFKKTWYSGDWVSFYMTFKFQGFWKLEIRQWSKGYNALTFCQKLYVYNLVTAYHYSGINTSKFHFRVNGSNKQSSIEI